MSTFLHLLRLNPCFICKPDTKKYAKYSIKNIDRYVYDLSH